MEQNATRSRASKTKRRDQPWFRARSEIRNRIRSPIWTSGRSFFKNDIPRPSSNRRFATTERPSARASASSIVSTTGIQTSTSYGTRNVSTWRKNQRVMGIWEAMEFLNTLVDDSDPDTDLTQIEHLMQTAEAIRADGHPRWFILTGLIHDLGKILCLFGEPQWAVVGDTFPVGCRYSDQIVFPEFFRDNPDAQSPSIRPNAASTNRNADWTMSTCRGDTTNTSTTSSRITCPRPPGDDPVSLAYPVHRENAYNHLMNDDDRRRMEWVRAFNPYDLYSKGHEPPDVEKLRPYYEDLIAEFFPGQLHW